MYCTVPMKKHCKTCTCGVKLERHYCTHCGTRKLAEFMKPTGSHGAFGKEQWECKDKERCNQNTNYR